ncbi:MAG: hypothetical protein J5982_04680 [Bacilli bacterium]|nr:hypothetical protein [Bacilli bacterium]
MKKINYIKIIIILINIIVISRIVIISHDRDYYLNLKNSILDKYITTNYAPRGRILDINGNILVDNKSKNALIFRNYNFSDQQLKNIIINVSNLIELDYKVNDNIKREYYYFLNKDSIDKRLDDQIFKDYLLKNINSSTMHKYKLEKISVKELESVDEKESYIFYLMSSGYSYDDKIIKKNITDRELTLINEANIDGLRCETIYERVYNYDTPLNQIFGSIGNITSEKLDYYMKLGYERDDIVGVSFLEEYYDEYLRGIPRKYKVLDNNSLEMIEDYQKGNDLVLSIDIEKQLEIDNVLKSEITNAKKYPASKYYNGSYVIVSDYLGRVVAMSGYYYNNGDFIDDALGNITNSYTVGSVVKGASQSVGYINNVINRDKKIKDSCVKLYSMPNKCSWKNLGLIDDIKALAYSSNYYQFINAIRVTGNDYKYNMKLDVTEDDFEKYRSVFKSYGLGSDTGIEISGYKGITGSKISGDLLLNLSIGQYDTYTPIMLNNYISTIANSGIRYNMSFGAYFINNKGNRESIDKLVLDRVKISNDDMLRIQKGLNGVVTYGTASNYLNRINGAGKTGTSETYVNGHKTLTKSFVAYLPFDNPKYNLTIVSPNLVDSNNKNKYNYPVNSRLSRQITNILFEN